MQGERISRLCYTTIPVLFIFNWKPSFILLRWCRSIWCWYLL